MNDWEKLNKILLTEKGDFCSYSNMEHITDVDYAHIKRVCKDFEIKNMTYMLKVTLYCYLMYLKTLEILVLKYTTLILQIFFQLLD